MADDDEMFGESIRRAKFALAQGSDTRLDADLRSALGDKLMAKMDAGGMITRDLDADAVLMLPDVLDVGKSMQMTQASQHETFEEIEKLLLLDPGNDPAKEGSRLNELLDRGGETIEQREVLRRGMIFLRRGMLREATEWWELNGQKEGISSPFAVLLTFLLAVTCRLAKDETRAAALFEQVQKSIGVSK